MLAVEATLGPGLIHIRKALGSGALFTSGQYLISNARLSQDCTDTIASADFRACLKFLNCKA